SRTLSPCLEMIQCLLDKGADPNYKFKFKLGRSPRSLIDIEVSLLSMLLCSMLNSENRITSGTLAAIRLFIRAGGVGNDAIDSALLQSSFHVIRFSASVA